MLSNEKSKFTDREIIEKGSRALIKELGYSGFLRFICHSEGITKEDYLKLENEIFNDMSLDNIYDNAKEHWENKKGNWASYLIGGQRDRHHVHKYHESLRTFLYWIRWQINGIIGIANGGGDNNG